MKAPVAAPGNPKRKLVALGALLLGVSLLHFSTATVGHWAHAGHVFFRKLYFIPIVAGAIWFGPVGATAVATVSVGIYALHVWLNWMPGTPERIDQIGEMGSFLVLAAVAGVLVMLERRAEHRAERVRRNSERQRVGTAVAALAETLGARDPTTLAHSRRVAALAAAFGRHLDLSAADVRSLYLAGIVHDIGKIGVRDDVLLKPETLTDEERAMIMEHPRIAEKILAPVGFEKVVRYAAVHHENVDGTGYPEGLRGGQIPLPGRVLAIADTYDALTSERPYKPPLDAGEVRRAMDAMAGTKLDSRLLRAFWAFLETDDGSRLASGP